MEPRTLLTIALMAGALSLGSCGEDIQATGDTGGAGMGTGGTGGILGGGDTGGAAGSSYQVCTLGLCMEDESLGASCLDVYDACVGRGHYPRSCRMDADKTCGVFGQTGPY